MFQEVPATERQHRGGRGKLLGGDGQDVQVEGCRDVQPHQERGGGQLEEVHERHVGGPLEGRGQEGDCRRGVAEDLKDPGQVAH